MDVVVIDRRLAVVYAAWRVCTEERGGPCGADEVRVYLRRLARAGHGDWPGRVALLLLADRHALEEILASIRAGARPSRESGSYAFTLFRGRGITAS